MPKLEDIIVDLAIFLALLLPTTVLLPMIGLYIPPSMTAILATVLHTHVKHWYIVWIRPNAIKVATLIAALIIWFS